MEITKRQLKKPLREANLNNPGQEMAKLFLARGKDKY
jgi:hypothetical protein